VVLCKPTFLESKDMAVNNTNLEQVGSTFTNKTTKFLGIYLDESLSWECQLAHINNTVSRLLYTINKVKHVLP